MQLLGIWVSCFIKSHYRTINGTWAHCIIITAIASISKSLKCYYNGAGKSPDVVAALSIETATTQT
jgi:hypothetical protein